MGELKGMKELFAGRHFDREIIALCVRWYLLSLCPPRSAIISTSLFGVREALEWLCTQERSLVATATNAVLSTVDAIEHHTCTGSNGKFPESHFQRRPSL
jgi:hypothetical protein